MQPCGLAQLCMSYVCNLPPEVARRPSESSGLLAPPGVPWCSGPDRPAAGHRRLASCHQLKPGCCRCELLNLEGFDHTSGELESNSMPKGRCAAQVLSLCSDAVVCQGPRKGEEQAPRHSRTARRQITPSHTAEIMSAIPCAPAMLASSAGQPWIPLLCLGATSWVSPPPNYWQARDK